MDCGKTKLRCMEIGIHGSLGYGEVALGCGEVGHGGLQAIQAGGGRFNICHLRAVEKGQVGPICYELRLSYSAKLHSWLSS